MTGGPEATLLSLGRVTTEQATLLALAVALLTVVLLLIELSRRHRAVHEADNARAQNERKLAAFEELAAGLAHEVRNPLTTISAIVFAMERRLTPGTPEQKDAHTIRREVHRANQMLKEFTQLARPTQPKLAAVRVDSLLAETCGLMGAELERLSVRLQVDEEPNLMLLADGQQIRQVLLNLVKNAAEAMPNGGRISLKAHCRVEPGGKAVIIEVRDEGSGIAPEVQKRLFEPFFSTKAEGTGLGLAVSHRIVTRHRGRLEFESAPGRGTVFRMTLPAYEPTGKTASPDR